MGPDNEQITLARQCVLLELARSAWHYHPKPENPEDLHLMRLLDEQYTRALDNVFMERLWRSVKYEEVYLHDYQTVPARRS